MLRGFDDRSRKCPATCKTNPCSVSVWTSGDNLLPKPTSKSGPRTRNSGRTRLQESENALSVRGHLRTGAMQCLTPVALCRRTEPTNRFLGIFGSFVSTCPDYLDRSSTTRFRMRSMSGRYRGMRAVLACTIPWIWGVFRSPSTFFLKDEVLDCGAWYCRDSA